MIAQHSASSLPENQFTRWLRHSWRNIATALVGFVPSRILTNRMRLERWFPNRRSVIATFLSDCAVRTQIHPQQRLFPSLCRAVSPFVVGLDLSALLRGSSGVFKRGRKEWPVVTAHASMAPHKPEKQKHACTIEPRLWPRTIHFKAAAIRTAVQPDPMHDDNIPCRQPTMPSLALVDQDRLVWR